MFLPAAGVEVGETVTEHGLLHLDLKRDLPDLVIQKIKIENDKQMKDITREEIMMSPGD